MLTYTFLTAESGFHAVARLDHVRLETYGSGPAVELCEETAGVAEDRAGVVAAP